MSTIRTAAVAVMVSFCLSQGIHASDKPLTLVAKDAPTFATLDDAAVAALSVALPLSSKLEHGGVLVHCGRHYTFSIPVTSGRAGTIEFDASIPRSCALAGLYHTHPGEGREALRFGAGDVFAAKGFNVRSYIGVVLDGSVRVFDPKDGGTSLDRTRMSVGATAAGVLVATLTK